MIENLQHFGMLCIEVIFPSILFVVLYAKILESINPKLKNGSITISLGLNLAALMGLVGLGYADSKFAQPFMWLWISIPCCFIFILILRTILKLMAKKTNDASNEK